MNSFDADSHIYTINGRRVPSVTQIIRATLPAWEAHPWYMQRGTALHHGCHLFDEGTLDWSSVDDEIRTRIMAWDKFRRESGLAIVDSENPLYHAGLQFAGTPDRIACDEDTGTLIIIDIKSTYSAHVIPQLGGYAMLARQADLPCDEAICVELMDDGKYKTYGLDRFALRRAQQTFAACLTLYGFMQQNGLKLKGTEHAEHSEAGRTGAGSGAAIAVGAIAGDLDAR